MREVLSAGLEARLYGRQGCPPLQFKLDKFFGSAWLAAMKIPEFKPSKRFVRGIKLPCLVGKVKNSEFSGIATRYIATTRRDPVCKIFLRVENLQKHSDWLQQTLKYLFKKNGLTDGVTKVLKGYMKTDAEADVEWVYEDFEEDERERVRDLGLAPYFRVSVIVVDEVERKVFVVGDTETEVFHEDDAGICFSKGRWRFDDWGRYAAKFSQQEEDEAREKLRRTWETIFPPPPKNTQVEDDGYLLFGVWRYNPKETAEARKQCGMPQDKIDSAFSKGTGLLTQAFYYAPTKYELLFSGYTAKKWIVERYERKGNWYEIQTESEGPWNRILWCDGDRLTAIGSEHVYTRVKNSYRKGKVLKRYSKW